MTDKPNAGERQRYLPYEWDTDGEPTAWQCRRCPVVVFSLAAVHKCETEQTNPLTLEQAVVVLNEKRWRGRDDWNHHAFDFIRSMGGTSDLELLLQADDAIGVAIGLLAQDRIAELEQNNRELLYNYEKQIESNRRVQAKRNELQQQLTDLTARYEALVAERDRLRDVLAKLIATTEQYDNYHDQGVPASHPVMQMAHAALAATEPAPDKPVNQEQVG